MTHLWPIEIAAEMKTKCKIELKCKFSHTTVNHRNNFNAPLDTLMCSLQIITDSEPLTLTLHGVNTYFIHHPFNVKNYSIGHKSETNWPNPKKIVILDNIFLLLSANFEVKIQNTQCYRRLINFSTSGKSALNSPANSPMVTHSKNQNRLSRAP